MEKIKMKEVPLSDRPRERLKKVGVSNLSDSELLAIILKTGNKDLSVKEFSSYLLSSIGGVKKIKDISYHELLKYKGIGEAKACMILAISELARRINSNMDDIKKVKYKSPDMIFDYYKDKVSNCQEEFYCLYLAANNTIIDEELVFIGTVNHSMVHPRDVFKRAYELNASYIICVHNHPSGDVRPSKDDENVTLRFKQIGALMGVRVIDHIIIGKTTYYSFLEEGKI